MKKIMLFTALMSLFSGTVFAAEVNLVANGSFEETGNLPYSAQSHLVGWTPVGVNIPNVYTVNQQTGPASDGNNFAVLSCYSYYGSCGLAGWQNSALGQDLSTEVGHSYTLRYDLKGNGDYGFGDGAVEAYWNGVLVSSTINKPSPGANSFNEDWFTFTSAPLVGTGRDSLIITLSDQPDIYYSVFLDRVSVTPVPEPETYALMLAGFVGVGVAARRRKS